MIILQFLPELQANDVSAVPGTPPSCDPENRFLLEDFVKKRQMELASEFCNLMTSDMSFESHNAYRLRFFKDVINEVSFRVFHHLF